MSDQAEPIGAEAVVPVTQADRDFAAQWIVIAPENAKIIRQGGWDHHHGVQAAFRHRIAASRTPDPKAADMRDKWESLIPAEAFWQVGHDGEGPDPSLIKARIFDPITMDRPIVGLGKTADSAVRSALSLISSTFETTLMQNHSSVDAGLAELIDALQAATVEEGATVFEHSAEEIGIMVMESHAIVLAALFRAKGGVS